MARILIVEDEPHSQEMAAVVCRAMGHDTLLASNGAAALRLLESGEVDLILLDGVMPVMDGFSLARRLRRDLRLKDVPIVGLTALAAPREQARFLEAGADLVVTKPYRAATLREAVQRFVEAAPATVEIVKRRTGTRPHA